MYPFRHISEQAKKTSYGGGRSGGDDGTLSRYDVLRSLEELGVHVDGWEADALLDRFTVGDGSDNVRNGLMKKLCTTVHTESCTMKSYCHT